MMFLNNFHRLETRLQSQVGRVIDGFNMIEDGDTIPMCLSGGKDSYTAPPMLMTLQKRAPVDFKLIAMNLNQKQPSSPEEVLPNYLEKLGVGYVIIEVDTYPIVKEKIPEDKTTYPLCSRPCCGVIYRTVKGLGANKIALGHHRNDVVNTFFLNMFFGGKMKSMPPELATDNGDHIVIRPFAYCVEKGIASYARATGLPIIPYNLCGSQEDLQHKKVKEMLLEWGCQTPGRIDNVFTSLRNIMPSRLVDIDLFDFNSLTTGLAKIDEGALLGQAVYGQAPLVFAGSHDDRIESVRFERKPGDKSAEQAVPGEATVNQAGPTPHGVAHDAYMRAVCHARRPPSV